ncbi:MAG: methylenetetrahydrofolate--tRNA-(uracil(54)-C(5))-methyltransferase (FADH(2)-oxidizing) TrmFO [Coriobacteriia bacterium]
MTGSHSPVLVVGAGLAGSEAAWQLAVRGIDVDLVEMRPGTTSPAHHTAGFAELVCSNSFKSADPSTAPGMLKAEMEAIGSLIVAVARLSAVPAGAALAVDRDAFSASVTDLVANHPRIRVIRREQTDIPADRDVILATGPLTSDALQPSLSEIVGEDRMAFFDAAAPIVDAATIDRDIVFAQSRYDKGEGADYLNCPFERDEYDLFIRELVAAGRVVGKDFETRELFSACQPIEEIARKGPDALRFGPMKPVGLTDPRTGRRPWAVLQLRTENAACTAYNLVGCQTNLTFPEQRRVFSLVPGLHGADIVRFGVMHRNTFIDAPSLLRPDLALRQAPRIRVAGQLSGTEGYLEAAASGLVAALGLVAGRTGVPFPALPAETALGALLAYATDPRTQGYQPMHVNFGLLPPAPAGVRGKHDRHAAVAAAGRSVLDEWVDLNFDFLRPGRDGVADLRTRHE